MGFIFIICTILNTVYLFLIYKLLKGGKVQYDFKKHEKKPEKKPDIDIDDDLDLL